MGSISFKKGPTWDPAASYIHNSVFGNGRDKPEFNERKPADLNFSDLTANNTQVLDENGNVRDQYALDPNKYSGDYLQQLSGLNLNTDALNKLRQQALSTDQSPWLALQQQNLQGSLADMRDSAVSQAGSGNAATLSALARSGGLSGGAAERAARQSSRDYNANRQQIARYGETEGNNLSIADQQQKQQMLEALPGMETQAFAANLNKANAGFDAQKFNSNLDQANIQTSLNELAQKRQFDMAQYQSKMAAYGADRTAFAQENAQGGGKGGGK